MHTGLDITCFFQDVKSSLTKHTVFWKRVMEPVKHLSCSLLQKKLTAYSRKQFPQKKSTLDVWEGSKEYQLLLWWILPQILTPPLNLKIWCRTPAPSLITHPPLSTIKLLRIQISKQALEKYRLCQNSGNDAIGKGWGVILLASLWRIGYENRFVTHSLIILSKTNFLQNLYRVFYQVTLHLSITFCCAWDKFIVWLCTVHEIDLSFGCAPNIDFIGFFLDISKANDKVRHPDLLYKLERNGVNGKLLGL